MQRRGGGEIQERDGDQLAYESCRAASKEKSKPASEISWTGVLSRKLDVNSQSKGGIV